MCIEGLLKLLGFIEIFGERKSIGIQKMETLLMNYQERNIAC